jgi:hypothetical protein
MVDNSVCHGVMVECVMIGQVYNGVIAMCVTV